MHAPSPLLSCVCTQRFVHTYEATSGVCAWCKSLLVDSKFEKSTFLFLRGSTWCSISGQHQQDTGRDDSVGHQIRRAVLDWTNALDYWIENPIEVLMTPKVIIQSAMGLCL